MSESPLPPNTADLAIKIARLVEEKGLNQEDFARMTNLNRQTVRQILLTPTRERRLRSSTIRACADALNLTVSELRTLPLEKLLPRMHARPLPNGDDKLRRLHDRASPELADWLERNPDRARRLTSEESEELLALQATGSLLSFGVEHFASEMERRRELFERVRAIARTEYKDLLERLVDLLYDKVRPHHERSPGERGRQPPDSPLSSGG